ncbi:LPXTG cell wall anchor domain-containing protein [Corynebacterium hindlerae]|uniref:LPXTG cell wall anchor domain-containing protein n=1 Tax=Corynebacterium hindlerae TaxID=699041 RepID=A0A7G5FCT1_9CORY|nr:SpaA isopeptide-forming pilin-related protein [Corynebacterium hindlerae]QMV84422.1 LPXTG cell wall anchor domain-containing protein [Corynebacterium hindlerae]
MKSSQQASRVFQKMLALMCGLALMTSGTMNIAYAQETTPMSTPSPQTAPEEETTPNATAEPTLPALEQPILTPPETATPTVAPLVHTYRAETESKVADGEAAKNKVVLTLDPALLVDGIVSIERDKDGVEFLGHGSVLLNGHPLPEEDAASMPEGESRGARIAVKLPEASWTVGDHLEIQYATIEADAGSEWRLVKDGAEVFSLRDDMSHAVEVSDPTSVTAQTTTTKAHQVQVPSKDKFNNGKCANSYVGNIYFYAPANVKATRITVKRTTALNLYIPPTTQFNSDTPNIKVAEFERMYRNEYKPLWNDIRHKEMVVRSIDDKTLEIIIPGGITMEKGEYVKLTNAFSYCSAGAPDRDNLEIAVTGDTQDGGFCEARPRYTFPARNLGNSEIGRLRTVDGDGNGNLVASPWDTLKGVSESGGSDPYRVFFRPNGNDNEYVLRHVPYQGTVTDGSLVVPRKPKRELSQIERDNGTNVYVSESKANGQVRWKSYVARQDTGTGSFVRLGGPNQETGWIINSLAFNPQDNWLYAISQGRLGEDWGRLAGQTVQGDAQNRFRPVITAEDPCFPAGHLLQIDPETGEVYNLGRVTPNVASKEYAFQGKKQAYWPNDLWGGINVGGIDKDGNYYVANASRSGTGAVYKVNLNDVTATPTDNGRKWLASGIRLDNDWNDVRDRSGRAWSEDWTPLFVPENPSCQPQTNSPCKQRQAGNYMWGISNGWNSQNGVWIERINLTDGSVQRWDITNIRTPSGQGISKPNQWGRAWTVGNGLLGFATASVGANDNVLRIKVSDPESSNPSFQLISVNAVATASYNSNGTSSVGFEENVVDLQIKKTRADITDRDGKSRIKWEIQVRNASEKNASTGFTVFDTIPKGYQVVRLESGNSWEQVSDGKSVRFGRWSAFVKKVNDNFVIEGHHGSLIAGYTATFSIIAEPINNLAPPKECVENVAGVIGIDRDPNTKKIEVGANGKDAFGNSSGAYGDLNYIGKTYSDIASDDYCRSRLTVIKHVEENNVKTEKVNGWAFTAATSGDQPILLDAGSGAKPEAVNASTLITGQTGQGKSTHPQGQVSWIINSMDEQKIRVTEDLAGHDGFKFNSVQCSLDGKNQNATVASTKDKPEFVVTVPKTAKVTCEVWNVKQPEEGTIAIQKATYDPATKGPINTGNLVGWAFELRKKDATTPAIELKPGDGTNTAKVTPGTYVLVETKAPANHSLLPQPIEFTIKRGKDANLELADVANGGGVVTFENPNAQRPNIILTVADPQTGTLPKTGGSGVAIPALLGVMLVLIGAVLTRRRKAHSA